MCTCSFEKGGQGRPHTDGLLSKDPEELRE